MIEVQEVSYGLEGRSILQSTVPEDVTELGARIDSLEKTQGELAQELSAQKSFMEELGGAVSKNESAISELSQSLGAFMSAEEIQRYFGEQNQKVRALEDALSRLTQSVEEISTSSSALSQKLENLEKKLCSDLFGFPQRISG